jgi:hypothetical protein
MLEALRRKLTRRSRGEPIVVVSGLPRSGHLDDDAHARGGRLAILADGERAADIDNPKGYFELERIKDLESEKDKSYLRAARGKAVKVISFLIQFLPDENDYRIVFMRRDLDEVLTSQKKMIDRLASDDTAADAAAMKEAFRNDIARVRVLCRTRPNFALCEVRYKDAVGRPAAASRAVNAFLGGGSTRPRCARPVDESLSRNRQNRATGWLTPAPRPRRLLGSGSKKPGDFRCLQTRDPASGPAPALLSTTAALARENGGNSMSKRPDLRATSTRSVHGGERAHQATDAVTTPIYQTSTFWFPDSETLAAYQEGRSKRDEYGRYGNPTWRAVERKLCDLEGAEAAVLAASGMCAATTLFLALLPSGGT